MNGNFAPPGLGKAKHAEQPPFTKLAAKKLNSLQKQAMPTDRRPMDTGMTPWPALSVPVDGGLAHQTRAGADCNWQLWQQVLAQTECNGDRAVNGKQSMYDLSLEHAGGTTTLMIRNIPSPYTPEALLQEWPNEGTYDFLYLPYSSRLQRNLTYVFINFTTPEAALDFKYRWQKMRLVRYSSQKPLNIGVADVQGRDENLRQLRKKRLLHTKVKQCQPIVFRNGVRIPLERALADLETGDELQSVGSHMAF
jgi:hypothetical protein